MYIYKIILRIKPPRFFRYRDNKKKRIIGGAAASEHPSPHPSALYQPASHPHPRAPWHGARAPPGTHHRFKTHRGLGTIDALVRGVSCCSDEEGEDAFLHVSRRPSCVLGPEDERTPSLPVMNKLLRALYARIPRTAHVEVEFLN